MYCSHDQTIDFGFIILSTCTFWYILHVYVIEEEYILFESRLSLTFYSQKLQYNMFETAGVIQKEKLEAAHALGYIKMLQFYINVTFNCKQLKLFISFLLTTSLYKMTIDTVINW